MHVHYVSTRGKTPTFSLLQCQNWVKEAGCDEKGGAIIVSIGGVCDLYTRVNAYYNIIYVGADKTEMTFVLLDCIRLSVSISF